VKGEEKSGDDFFLGRFERKPEELESPGEQIRPRPELILWVAVRGAALSVGESRWSTAGKLIEFSWKVQERNWGWETDSESPKGRKALEGEAQECWRLKKASKVRAARSTSAERVAKPYVRGLRKTGQTFSGRSSKRENEKRGCFDRIC
jgi:hypothetical protein